MSNVTTLQCDGDNCGKLRVSDTNHWLYGVLLGKKIMMGFLTHRDTGATKEEKHFCGEQCATRWFITELSKLREHAD